VSEREGVSRPSVKKRERRSRVLNFLFIDARLFGKKPSIIAAVGLSTVEPTGRALPYAAIIDTVATVRVASLGHFSSSASDDDGISKGVEK
jgi:hypothetical protein